MKNLKIVANYLPQYHETNENNMWWGKGYTDWNAVKMSKVLFKGHIQPKKPLNDFYYSLDKKEDIKWQADMARKYKIDAFGIYHYWFSSDKILLDTPSKIILENKDIDIEFLFIWDNATWKRTWSNVKVGNDWAPQFESKTFKENDNGILAELIYGEEDEWKKHFQYLLPFFKDNRYIKIDNKPIFCFFNQNFDPDILKRMCDYWNLLAIDAGFDGIIYYGKKNKDNISIMNYDFCYEPEWSGWQVKTFFDKVTNKLNTQYHSFIHKPYIYDYDKIWEEIIENAKKSDNGHTIFGGFVNYDDTPRRGNKGKVILNSSPKKFKKYMKLLINESIRKENPIVFITAWNEWGEGAYLEPDNMSKTNYLESLKEAIESLENKK